MGRPLHLRRAFLLSWMALSKNGTMGDAPTEGGAHRAGEPPMHPLSLYAIVLGYFPGQSHIKGNHGGLPLRAS